MVRGTGLAVMGLTFTRLGRGSAGAFLLAGRIDTVALACIGMVASRCVVSDVYCACFGAMMLSPLFACAAPYTLSE